MRFFSEYFKVISTWTNEGYDGSADDGVFRWVSGYYEHLDLRMEYKMLAERKFRLCKLFEDWNLPKPNILIDDGYDALSPKTLKVHSIYTPKVEADMLRPIVELRIPAPTNEEVQEYLIFRIMRLGATAINDVYASAKAVFAT